MQRSDKEWKEYFMEHGSNSTISPDFDDDECGKFARAIQFETRKDFVDEICAWLENDAPYEDALSIAEDIRMKWALSVKVP